MLGVQMTNTNRRIQIDQGLNPGEGIFVRDVYSDTAADHLGIQPNDVILNINGNTIGSMSDLRETVQKSEVGDEVSVIVRREGRDVALSGASYNAWPQDIPLTPLNTDNEERHHDRESKRLGNALNDLSNLGRKADNLDNKLEDMQLEAAGEPIPSPC